MKRDLDLIRTILLHLEAKDGNEPCWGEDLAIPGERPLDLAYHSNILAQAGFIDFEPVTTQNGRIIKCLVFSLSWKGHEYLDTIRDPDIWERTKAGAKKAGGFSLEMLAAIARALIKSKFKELTGLDVAI